MENLRILREEHNLKQEDIANILGIKRPTYTSYEIERDTIPINHLNTLCNYFHISVDYALGLTNKKYYKDMKEDVNKELLCYRLKELRTSNKLTQQKIAIILNTSRSAWTNYEHGRYQIPTLLLFELARKYHYSMDYLLGKIDKNML